MMLFMETPETTPWTVVQVKTICMAEPEMTH